MEIIARVNLRLSRPIRTQWSFHIGLGGVSQKMYLEVKTGKNKLYKMFRGLTLCCKKNLGHFGEHLLPIFREGAYLKNRKSQNVSRFSFLAITPVLDMIETWGFHVDLPLEPLQPPNPPFSLHFPPHPLFFSFLAIIPVWDLIEFSRFFLPFYNFFAFLCFFTFLLLFFTFYMHPPSALASRIILRPFRCHSSLTFRLLWTVFKQRSIIIFNFYKIIFIF